MNNKLIQSFIAIIILINFVAKAQNEKIQKPKLTAKQKIENFKKLSKTLAEENSWFDATCKTTLTREILSKAIESARIYLLNNQKKEGNFNYYYSLRANKVIATDNPIAQAATIWSINHLSLCRPTAETQKAAKLATRFLIANNKLITAKHFISVYTNYKNVNTSEVAYHCLTMMDFCKNNGKKMSANNLKFYTMILDKYITHLRTLELPGASWGENFICTEKKGDPFPSAFSDSLCFYTYCKAVKNAGYKELIPIIEKKAPLLMKIYTWDAWNTKMNNPDTIAFYNYSCMAIQKYVEAGWKDSDFMADCAIMMTWWLLKEHELSRHTDNTSYLLNGLLATYKIAKIKNRTDVMEKLEIIIKQELVRIISWQARGPIENENLYFSVKTRISSTGQGGIMTTKNSGIICIDHMQFFITSAITALELFYPKENNLNDK